MGFPPEDFDDAEFDHGDTSVGGFRVLMTWCLICLTAATVAFIEGDVSWWTVGALVAFGSLLVGYSVFSR